MTTPESLHGAGSPGNNGPRAFPSGRAGWRQSGVELAVNRADDAGQYVDGKFGFFCLDRRTATAYAHGAPEFCP
jgi:hypothetical protein